MLRLVGFVVVVLLVLSLAHGERSGAGDARDTLADALTGRLADGVRTLGDIVFGRGDPAAPDSLRTLGRNLDALSRTADGASRRALAGMVLRSCPSLGLVCQPAVGPADPAVQRRGQPEPLPQRP